MLLSQHQVLSSNTIRPRAPCGARCMGHTIRMWSGVCLRVMHSQFDEGERPHLCMDEWNHSTPVHRQLNLTQARRHRCRLKRYPLQVRHKQDWGRGFILLLPQTAELPGSDTGSDVIKPASSFVIQNRQTSCSMW